MFFTVLTLLAICGVHSQPPPCIEDSQCPDNFFCEVPTHVCRKCLNCQELNRSTPSQRLKTPSCFKSDDYCGPCVEGWNLRQSYHGQMCEPGDAKSVHFLSQHIYIWLTGAGTAVGLMITVLFLHVLRSSNVPIPLISTTSIVKWPGIANSLFSPDLWKVQKPLKKEKTYVFVA